MGRPKLLLPYRGTTLAGSVIAALRGAGVGDIVLVTAPGDDDLRAWARTAGVIAAVNPDPSRGMLSSILEGIAALGGAAELARRGDVLLVSPADLPGLQAKTVAELLRRQDSARASLAVPSYRGRRGHPLAVAPWHIPEIETLDLNIGLRQLLDRHPGAVLEVEVDDLGAVEDVDTPGDYMRATRERPIVIAHRGASGYRPEHTLAAYELAIEQGADFIEPDLVATRDGILIARHENEISETTDVADLPQFAGRRATRRIDGVEATGWFAEDFTLAEIKTLRARERLPFRDRSFDGRFEVPTLSEILDLARRASRETGRAIGVYPETKHPTYFRSIGLPLEEPLIEALHAAGYQGRSAPVYLQSFETGNLKVLRRLTDLPLIQLLDVEGGPWDLYEEGRSYSDLMAPAGLAEIAGYADGIGPNKRLIVPVDAAGRLGAPTTLVEDAHRAGLRVHPWTFRSDTRFLASEYGGDPAREYERFFALGIDGLFTDFPDAAIAARRA